MIVFCERVAGKTPDSSATADKKFCRIKVSRSPAKKRIGRVGHDQHAMVNTFSRKVTLRFSGSTRRRLS